MTQPTTNISDRTRTKSRCHDEVEVDSALSTPFGLFGRLPREIREMIYIPVLAGGNTSIMRVRVSNLCLHSPFLLPYDYSDLL